VFDHEEADALLLPRSLSFVAMPRSVAQSMSRRTGSPVLLSDHGERSAGFMEGLKRRAVYDAIRLPELDRVKSGAIPVPLFDLIDAQHMFYTPEEYAQHLAHMIELMQTCERYHVILRDDDMDSCALYVKEGLGLIASMLAPASGVFLMNESCATEAIWQYLLEQLRLEPRGDVIEKLRQYLSLLKA
jgi:hypothetical protein